MIDTLNSYLVQHKSISIPGLGTIYIERLPAQRAADTQQLLPPSFIYRFDKFHDTPVKEFFLFVADRKSIPEYEAIKLYNEFAASFRSEIKLKEEAVWKDVGVFRNDDSGGIVFEQLSKPFALFAPVDAAVITRTLQPQQITSAEEDALDVAPDLPQEPAFQTRKATTWRVYALALFALTVIMLCIHFYNKGIIWQAFFNQQSVK